MFLYLYIYNKTIFKNIKIKRYKNFGITSVILIFCFINIIPDDKNNSKNNTNAS